MNRIKQLFKNKPRDILNIYFTAGYPRLDSLVPIITSLAKEGADMVEIGIPYSDPLADGPTIQDSSQQALRNGISLDIIFNQIKEARQQVDIPFIVMGYFNPVMQYGEDRFLDQCVESGVDGLIIPDMPLHEFEQDFRERFKTRDLTMSFLITPETPAERIHRIDELSSGFIYVVSNSSITGAKKAISSAQIAYFERIASLSLQNPTLIGFGISNRDTFQTACRYAQGAIVGSAYIKSLAGSDSIERTTQAFIEQIK